MRIWGSKLQLVNNWTYFHSMEVLAKKVGRDISVFFAQNSFHQNRRLSNPPKPLDIVHKKNYSAAPDAAAELF